jgi:hypothetical protein
MTAIDKTPTNQNFLSPLNFKFVLKRAPHVNFFIQRVTVPSINLPATFAPNPMLRIPYAGDQLEFDELEVSFRVDENLQNYLELQNWIRAAGKLTFESHKNLTDNSIISGESLTSEISLSILSSAKRPNYEIVFEDAFPTRISRITFDSSLEDVSYLEAEASFRYSKYEINKIIA